LFNLSQFQISEFVFQNQAFYATWLESSCNYIEIEFK